MSKLKNIVIATIVLLLVVVGITLFKLSSPGMAANQQRSEILKKQQVVELLNSFAPMKMDYAIRLLAEDMPDNSSPSGFAALELANYGLNALQQISIDGADYERRIELRPQQIIVTFGEGFDGASATTFIVEAVQLADAGIDWRCSGGSLSNKYRPPSCIN